MLTLEQKRAAALDGRVKYECHFPDGEVRILSWDQLHVELKSSDRSTYERVKYRPIYPEAR